MNDPTFIQAAMTVAAYRALGDPLGNRDRIEEAVLIADKWRRSAVAMENKSKEQFYNFQNDWDTKIKSIDDEWKEKIEGFVAATALSAPKTFWRDRANKHEKLANKARTRWVLGIVSVLIIFVVGAIVAFTGVDTWLNGKINALLGVEDKVTATGSEAMLMLASLLKRALVLGGILGIGVWWLRQLLRELRSHEHLAEDAAERVTMIETYAALKAMGLGSEDFSPILTALYRAAATGLVVDDGGGPIFPWEALLKAATGSKSSDK